MFAYSRTARSTASFSMTRFLCNPSTGSASFKGRRAPPIRQKPPTGKNILLAGVLLASAVGIYTVSIRKMSGQVRKMYCLVRKHEKVAMLAFSFMLWRLILLFVCQNACLSRMISMKFWNWNITIRRKKSKREGRKCNCIYI